MQAYTLIEDKNELIYDYIGKGGILRANHFLSLRPHHYKVKVLDFTIYYFLKLDDLYEIGQ